MAIRVLESIPTWLGLTKRWLYELLRPLPDSVRTHVVCKDLDEPDKFPMPSINAFVRRGRVIRWREALLRQDEERAYLAFQARLARRVGARLIHSHFGNTGWRDMGAARDRGLAHVVSFYGYDLDYLVRKVPIWSSRYSELFPAVDKVLVEGPAMRRKVRSLGCPDDKIQVLHLGTDVAAIPFRPRSWSPNRPLRLLMAATFTEKKGYPYALQALSRLAQEIPIEVSIIGDATDQPRSQSEKATILDTLRSTGLQKHSRLLGFQPAERLLQEIWDHDVFLAPSVEASDGDSEGGAPTILFDVAASGMPIVATRHADIPEVVVHGQTGRLAAERDAEGLYAELRWLVDHPSQWESMLQAGRKRMQEEFDAPRQAAALAEVYHAFGARR